MTTLSDPIHFIGIGGSGMFPLAQLALHLGYKIQGSDAKQSPNTLSLEEKSVPIFYTHNRNNLLDAKTVVLSSAIKPDNIEYQYAQNLSLPTLHRSELLQHFMENKSAITVAGTHGKTTTSALVTYLLEKLGQSPQAVVGGYMHDFKSYTALGTGKYLVAEADESDGTFLKYNPYIGIITNIDLDHLDYYKDIHHLTETFKIHFSNIVKQDGYAILGWDNSYNRYLAGYFPKERWMSYGFYLGADFRAYDAEIIPGEGTIFNFITDKEKYKCKLKIVGEHNVLNATAALSVAKLLGLNLQDAVAALENFSGVKRRLSLVYGNAHLKIYDDYAHNPGKIAACISSLKKFWPNHKLVVIFQPHRYSRLKTMYNIFTTAFSFADLVLVTPVYAAGEPPMLDLDMNKVSLDISRGSQVDTHYVTDFSDALHKCKLIAENHQPTVFLTVGAGNISEFSETLKEVLV